MTQLISLPAFRIRHLNQVWIVQPVPMVLMRQLERVSPHQTNHAQLQLRVMIAPSISSVRPLVALRFGAGGSRRAVSRRMRRSFRDSMKPTVYASLQAPSVTQRLTMSVFRKGSFLTDADCLPGTATASSMSLRCTVTYRAFARRRGRWKAIRPICQTQSSAASTISVMR